MTYSSHVLVQHVEYICYRLPPRSDSIHRMTYCTALILDNTNVLHCMPHWNVPKSTISQYAILSHFRLYSNSIVCQPHYDLVQPSTAQLGLEQQQMIDIIFPLASYASTVNNKPHTYLINTHKVSFPPCICKGRISPHLLSTLSLASSYFLHRKYWVLASPASAGLVSTSKPVTSKLVRER